MHDIDNLNLVCLSESELIQWQSRGSVHLAACRVIPSGVVKNAGLFALAPCSRLDDAKARIVVQLKNSWRDQSNAHPLFSDTSVLSLSLDLIEAIGPTLNQFGRRLESFDLPLAKWDVSNIWDDWLFSQGRYERVQVITQELRKLGFNSRRLLDQESFIAEFIGKAMRPNGGFVFSRKLPIGWCALFEQRDQILKKLRFEGHSDRLSFLQASVKELLAINSVNATEGNYQLISIERESGWVFKDLTADIVNSILNISGPEPLSMERTISPLIGAIYLRLFDELHYGEKDWTLCFNLLRHTKYSIDSEHADLLMLCILGSLTAEELNRMNLVQKFNTSTK